MLQLLVVLLHFIYLPFVGATGGLQLNPQATLSNEVTSIQHNDTTRQVVIHLATDRKCTQPSFVVRLSGIALYLLDEVPGDLMNSSSVTFQYPPLLETGTYFLEVLTIYCEPLDPDSFQDMCLISPHDGDIFLTLPYSFEVKDIPPTEKNTQKRPRWVLGHNATAAILPTRYQKWCLRNKGGCSKTKESDIAQHNMYEWTDKPPYEHLVQKTFDWGLKSLQKQSSTENESITICMVGALHEHNLAFQGNALRLEHINFTSETSRFPQLFNVRTLRRCTYAVLGYGQLPLSFRMKKEPYNGIHFEKVMRRVLSSVLAANLTTQVFVRSLDLSPLGYRESTCPTGDYRHPPIVRMYNKILAYLCAEYKIPFIDLHPVQGPLWDSALDWNHPIARIVTAEAEFILHSVLSHSRTIHRAPQLDSNFIPVASPPSAVNTPSYRFNQSDKLYAFVGGEYRAIPSEKVMYRMGIASRHIIVVNATTSHHDYMFGPPIPDI